MLSLVSLKIVASIYVNDLQNEKSQEINILRQQAWRLKAAIVDAIYCV